MDILGINSNAVKNELSQVSPTHSFFIDYAAKQEAFDVAASKYSFTV